MVEFFNIALVDPMINLLVILYNVLFSSFGLAIIAFTLIVRLITWPLTYRQLKQTRIMQSAQPRMQEIQKKYSDPRRRQEEMMKVYKEVGFNPLGCFTGMVVQIPILFALFYTIRVTLPESPEALDRLGSRLYDWAYIQSAIPIEDHFLGLDLKVNSNIFMVLLVGLTTFLQTKTTTTVTTDERMRAQQQMMAYMMPLMFGFFALSFPNGVSLYWIVNSLIGILFNILVYGLPIAKIKPLMDIKVKPAGDATGGGSPVAAAVEPAREPRTAHEPSRSKRQNRRRRSG
ncbi:MAG: YidC/Oxa1 family membrane protein insertase [Dehalococcoidia bacterium]